MTDPSKAINITICADDFAQNSAISHAIVELSLKNKISATSCMTNTPNWKTHAKLLDPIQHIDKGVHLNFTHSTPLTSKIRKKINKWPSSLLTLIRWLITKQLSLEDIELEIEAQLNQFERYTQQRPDFIDGHQHIHHFPQLRLALLNVYEKKYLSLPNTQRPYVRISSCRPTLGESYWFKKKVIQWFGSEILKNKLIEKQIPFNKHFSGVYPFNKKISYGAVLSDSFNQMKNNTLLMCHPGMSKSDLLDPIAPYRYNEYQYFLSPEFSNLCLINNITLSRYDRS